MNGSNADILTMELCSPPSGVRGRVVRPWLFVYWWDDHKVVWRFIVVYSLFVWMNYCKLLIYSCNHNCMYMHVDMYRESRSLFGKTNKIFLRFRITIDHKRGFTNQHSVRQVQYVWDLGVKFFFTVDREYFLFWLFSFLGNCLSYRICQLFHNVIYDTNM